MQDIYDVFQINKKFQLNFKNPGKKGNVKQFYFPRLTNISAPLLQIKEK